MDVGLRMLVPRRLSRRRGENLHEKVMAFFLARGELMAPNLACLRLPASFPAILEGRVDAENYRAFLSEFPHPELLTILADTGLADTRRAAA